jgi:DNA-binding HxlR family transcriptional regulator
MRTIDPKNLPTEFVLSEARKADLGEHPRLLDGFLYVGLSVLFSEPGLGKSMLQGQVEEHLAYGRPFGHWVPERPVRCMVIDLEGDMRLASERSLTITPFGLLRSDHDHPMSADIYYATEWRGGTFYERLAVLEERLIAAEEAGEPFGYVRVDTLRLFLGSKPHGANAYEWDAFCLRQMNKLALKHDICLVLVHHTNKAGEVSGSTGVAGSVVCIMQIRRNPDNDDECQLLSHKVRVDVPFRYALMMDDRGRWEFTEAITPTQAELGGAKRSIVNVLTGHGPQVLQDLREHLPGLARNTLKSALTRLKHGGIVAYRRGRWELTEQTLADHPRCQICDLPMTAFMPGQTTHPTCTPDPWAEETVHKFLGRPVLPEQQQAPVDVEQPAGHPDEDDQEHDQEHPEVAKFPAFQELRASIAASRMKPLPCVSKTEREGLPWSLITKQMDGAHQSRAWQGTIPEGTEWVVVLDRNGSFPSAMSSVPVAPNKLLHTGPKDSPIEREGLAGICQITIPEWDADGRGMPHPLGRLAAAGPGELVWVTSSHVEYLDRLAREGLVPMVRVHDSWLGRRNTSLFERYYKWARLVREQTAGMDEETRTQAKRSISRAIRALHPTQTSSPFWRPDWHRAVVAQSAVRHWATAWRAVHEGGASLLSIGMTDEVVFAVPPDEEFPKLWVPAPYRIGGGYGMVKHKAVKVDGEMVMSPLTVEQWKGSRRGSSRQR